MPYMIYEQYKIALKQAYSEEDDLVAQHAEAARCREWLNALKIDPELRQPMVEPVAAIEEAFRELLKSKSLT